MKKFFNVMVVVLAVLLLLSSTSFFLGNVKGEQLTTINIYVGKDFAYVNGVKKSLDQGPVIQGGRVLVPLRFIGEAMGAKVEYNDKTKEITLSLLDVNIKLTVNSVNAIVNGYNVKLDVAATIISGRTMVPVRFISESLGASVMWDAGNKMVTVIFSQDWIKNKAKVIFWEAMGGKLGETLEAMTKEFNATHPNISVELVKLSDYGALQQKTLAAIAAGDPPLIAQAYENWAANYITGFYLTPFESYINGNNGLSKTDIADIFPKMWDSGLLPDGKRWMVPFNKSTLVMYYNKDMFKAAGFSGPPKTWDEFSKYCEILTKEEGGQQIQWGASHTPSVDMWYSLIYAYGGRVLNDDFTRVLFNSEKALKPVKLFNDLYTKKYMHVTTGYGDQADFGAGKAGMYFGSVVGRSYVEQAVGGKFEIGEASLPAGPSGSVTVLYGTNVVMFGAAPKYDQRQRDAAWVYIKWFIGTEQQAYWSANSYYMPVRRSSLNSKLLVDLFKTNPELKAGIDQLDNAVLQPPTAAWSVARSAVSRGIQKIYLQKISPEQGMKDLAEEIQKIINP